MYDPCSRQHVKDLPINDLARYFGIYKIWTIVDADLKKAGLGIPSTFADHLSRVNSKDDADVLAEKAWFESLIVLTYK